MQDAYIVAATRTAVGKAPRGMFRTTRPDDMLAHVLRSVLAQVPALDPSRVEDVIVGCAMPEDEQGMNVARIGVLLAGLPNSVAGMTINRFCSSGLNAVSIAADRIRTGEADIMIAAGTESMSMSPDARAPRAQRGGVRARRERRHRLRHGTHRGEGRRAVEGVARGAGRVRAGVAPEGAGRAGSGRVRGRDQPVTRRRGRARPCQRQGGHAHEGRRARRGSARRHQRRRPREAAAGVRRQGLGDRRQQLADVRRRGRVDPGLGARAARARPRRRSRAGSASRSPASRPRSWASGRSRRFRRC